MARPILCRPDTRLRADLRYHQQARRGDGWLAGCCSRSYLLTCRVLGVAVLVFRSDRAMASELLVLRHENAVLRRHVGRIRYEPVDRAWFAALARFLPRRLWTEIFPVTPTTLLAWHRKLAAKKYDTSRQRKPGRPPTARSIARLAVRLAKENPGGDTAGYTASWQRLAWLSRRPRCGRSCVPRASIRRRAGQARP